MVDSDAHGGLRPRRKKSGTRVVARSEAVRLAHERVRRYVLPGRRLAGELIAERRAEVRRGKGRAATASRSCSA